LTRIAVSGHRGLSAQVEALIAPAVKAELARVVPEGSELVGLSCLADGADQIFACAVLDCGGNLEVVVPAEQYRDDLPDTAKPLYDELFRRATAVHKCSHDASTSEAHMDASKLMVDRADRLFAIWDGKPARSYGGTADVVQYAKERGVPVVVIWPDGAYRD